MTNKIVLSLSMFLAIILFFTKLESTPPAIYSDESTVGYNAFSILKTGRDEYGKAFPLAFRFFGAYTPPLAVYFTVPFVYLFGLNPISVRLLSAISSLFLVVVLYRLATLLNLFKNKYVSALCSLIFVTTPWVIFNARLGYEVTFGYALFYLGVLFVWRSYLLNRVSFWGLIFLSLSTYTAHTERYLVPLFLLCFLLIYRSKVFIKKNVTSLSKGILLLFVLHLPHLYLLTTPAFWVKNLAFGSGSLSLGIRDFIGQLIVYFSPQTYFGTLTSDINLQHFIPEISLFYSWQLVLFVLGVFVLVTSPKTDSKKLLFLLLITSPIPGAFSGHFISIQRVLPVIIPIILIIGIGIDEIITKTKKTYFVFLLLFLSFTFSLSLFYRSYFILLPGLRASWWSYGAQDISEFIKSHPQEEIIIDNSRDQAIYSPIVFYNAFPPKQFQKQFGQVLSKYYQNPSYSPVVSFAKVTTRPINWEIDSLESKYLIGDSLAVSADQAKEHFLTKVQTIKDKRGQVLYEIYKTNPKQKIDDNRTKLQKRTIIKNK